MKSARLIRELLRQQHSARCHGNWMPYRGSSVSERREMALEIETGPVFIVLSSPIWRQLTQSTACLPPRSCWFHCSCWTHQQNTVLSLKITYWKPTVVICFLFNFFQILLCFLGLFKECFDFEKFYGKRLLTLQKQIQLHLINQVLWGQIGIKFIL